MLNRAHGLLDQVQGLRLPRHVLAPLALPGLAAQGLQRVECPANRPVRHGPVPTLRDRPREDLGDPRTSLHPHQPDDALIAHMHNQGNPVA